MNQKKLARWLAVARCVKPWPTPMDLAEDPPEYPEPEMPSHATDALSTTYPAGFPDRWLRKGNWTQCSTYKKGGKKVITLWSDWSNSEGDIERVEITSGSLIQCGAERRRIDRIANKGGPPF